MIRTADTVGVFQIESRAQMSMLPRLKPATFYDLVIEVAIVRPGPIQGNMVHPYLRRARTGTRQRRQPNRRQSRQVLGRTLGVPIFQEQVMKLCDVAAGFHAGRSGRSCAVRWRHGDATADSSISTSASSTACSRTAIARNSRAHLRADQGFRRIRFSRIAFGTASRCSPTPRRGSRTIIRPHSPARC